MLVQQTKIMNIPGDGSCALHSQLLSLALFMLNSHDLYKKLSAFNSLIERFSPYDELHMGQCSRLLTSEYLNQLKEHFKDQERQMQIIQDFENFFPGLIKKNLYAQDNNTKIITNNDGFDQSILLLHTMLGYQSHSVKNTLMKDTYECMISHYTPTLITTNVPGISQLIDNLQNYKNSKYFQCFLKHSQMNADETEKLFISLVEIYRKAYESTFEDHDEFVMVNPHDRSHTDDENQQIKHSLLSQFIKQTGTNDSYQKLFKIHLLVLNELYESELRSGKCDTSKLIPQNLNFPKYLQATPIQNLLQTSDSASSSQRSQVKFFINERYHLGEEDMSFFYNFIAPEFSLASTGTSFLNQNSHWCILTTPTMFNDTLEREIISKHNQKSDQNSPVSTIQTFFLWNYGMAPEKQSQPPILTPAQQGGFVKELPDDLKKAFALYK